jgi:lysophospholipase L1-like esterase
MRVRVITAFVLAMLCAAATSHAALGQTYYLALGDSLSLGAQPTPNDSGLMPTPQGYVNDIYNKLSLRNPSLQLEQLGCIGETTTSMIRGGVCETYGAAGSQLDAALSFIEHHKISLITLDIGANDIDACISTNGIDDSCVNSALGRVGADLSFISAELRRAAGPNVRIVGMNYYDPFLAAWTLGPDGEALAIRSLAITDLFNGLLDSVYHAFDIPIADVGHAFRINNFATVPGEDIPVNVFLTFAYTYMKLGATAPNVHPNQLGYSVIATAFGASIGL